MTQLVRVFSVVAVICCAAGTAWAGSIDLGGGWRANWPPPNNSIGITVDQVTPDFIKIQISKDFTDPPVNGLFPPRVIDFVQIKPDQETVPRIIILDETATNLTGADWTDYHWEVLNMGDAWFNVPLSNAWDVTPFTSKVFSDPNNVFGDPNKATDLDADGGLVANFDTFFPGHLAGELVIDVDLTPGDPVSFTFKQYPTPEPTSLALLACGALIALRRRG